MAKYKHHPDTLLVLEDLENRVIQMTEANELYKNESTSAMIESQNTALGTVLVLVRQLKNTGHIRRGNSAFPDDLEPLAKTKWAGRPQLGLNDQGNLL